MNASTLHWTAVEILSFYTTYSKIAWADNIDNNNSGFRAQLDQQREDERELPSMLNYCSNSVYNYSL